MDRYFENDGTTEPGKAPPSNAELFARALRGEPIPRIIGPEAAARAAREELERLAQFSPWHAEELSRIKSAEAEARRERESLEWAAQISSRAEEKLQALRQQEAAERAAWRQAEEYVAWLSEIWDSSKHPRGGFSQNRGWWSSAGGSGSAVPGGGYSAAGRSSFTDATGNRSGGEVAGPFQTAAYRPGQSQVKLVAADGVVSASWPTFGPASRLLPKVGPGAAAAAATGVGIAAGGFLAGLRNASMGAYWAQVPGTQAMPSVWVHELEKRVRAGTLSREDAIGIFNTAVLGAEAQGFKPAGNVMSAVHKSITDFLGKAEAVYFARKKETGWATQPGGYQQSGGRVFPTKKNSGLDGYALRQEQEEFFERGLAQGKTPAELRGQADVAGSKRAGGHAKPDDRLVDPEAEAALQRALKKTKH